MKPLTDLIGESPGIAAVRAGIARLLERQHDVRRLPPVLIEGETGTGKGLLARMIHRAGPRADGPFVDVNCAAIPETLLEAEMFGYERGAFTDARRAKPGLFQTAHRGTIFLDEVGLLPEALQSKLLKVLEERSVRRLGSTRDEPVDVWVLTATNEDLRQAIRARRCAAIRGRATCVRSRTSWSGSRSSRPSPRWASRHSGSPRRPPGRASRPRLPSMPDGAPPPPPTPCVSA